MKIFDRIEIEDLDRRDRHLWLLAIVMIVILGTGVALLMYPSVFAVAPGSGDVPVLRRTFVAFCVLNFLFVVYVLDRQIAVRRLRRCLIEEERQNTELRARASSELIRSLPDFNHFQDRLAMQFRRASHSHEALTLLVVGLKPSGTLRQGAELETAYGDAAKAILRKLRTEDSVYRICPGVFGVLLPGVNGRGLEAISTRLAESLTDVAGAAGRFAFEMETVSYPENVTAAHEMEIVARSRLEEVAKGELMG
ncbi:MAG TPA: GGDEF domain-containing protein [Terriglobia bacterium]|nr:GGDEF domain-containing protein [Terriglobia bacterium]